MRERLLQDAIAEWRVAGDSFHEAQAFNRLGRYYHRLGRYTEAQQAFETALALWNGLGDPFGRLETLKLLANLGGFFGQERAPLAVLKEYLESWVRLGDRRGQALLTSSIATNYYRARDFHQSILYETRALRLRERLGNGRAIADSLDSLSGCYREAGQLDQAFLHAQRALWLYREIGGRRGIAAGLSRFADVLEREGRYEEMARALEESLTIQQAEGDLSAEEETLRRISSAEIRRGHLKTALSKLRRAVAIQDRLSGGIAEPIWKWGFGSWARPRVTYVSALLALHWKEPDAGYGTEAFLEADHARGRYIMGSEPAQLSELSRMMEPDTTLLEYWSDGDMGAVWILRRDGLQVQPLPNLKEIHSLAQEAVRALSNPNSGGSQPKHATASGDRPAEYQAIASRLSRLLLAPVASALSAQRILVVSDGTFEFLPFAALPDPTRADGVPLLAHHEIVYLVSATSALAAQKRQRPRAGGLLAVLADPVFEASDSRAAGSVLTQQETLAPDVLRAIRSIGTSREGAGIPRLPYARHEAQAIASLAPSQTALFLDFAATRQRAINALGRYRLLHFTTHGVVNSADPDLSGLIFSLVNREGRPQDGFLRLGDIYALKTSADLITMAACQTAIGRQIDVHSAIGLTGAFLHAGAARVISTVWKVDDEATAELMTTFYRRLLHERLSPASALRQAQLSMAASERWRSPYYWAGFLLYGDWRTLWQEN